MLISKLNLGKNAIDSDYHELIERSGIPFVLAMIASSNDYVEETLKFIEQSESILNDKILSDLIKTLNKANGKYPKTETSEAIEQIAKHPKVKQKSIRAYHDSLIRNIDGSFTVSEKPKTLMTITKREPLAEVHKRTINQKYSRYTVLTHLSVIACHHNQQDIAQEALDLAYERFIKYARANRKDPLDKNIPPSLLRSIQGTLEYRRNNDLTVEDSQILRALAMFALARRKLDNKMAPTYYKPLDKLTPEEVIEDVQLQSALDTYSDVLLNTSEIPSAYRKKILNMSLKKILEDDYFQRA